MGVLDDAIREHLELKRKLGTTGEELERQEAEALGPARRRLDPPEPEAVEAAPTEPALPGEAAGTGPGLPEPSEAEPVDEDVLEETPDFLEETPEHDRLWFEQKPPRDFDFD